jgi:UDP-2-acetamido-2-deoxy-ribo-hexuluronate aminotransferase
MNQHTRVSTAPIPFIDVAAQRRRLGRAIDDAVARVLDHCQFIMGPEVRAAEADLAAFCGARHAITCASGTDALVLPLMAKGIGPGDAVICPGFTFHGTAEVVALVGATPVFADVEDGSFNIDPKSVERAVATARRLGLNLKAVIPVDLFGQPADYDAIFEIARAEKLFVLGDAAQSFGARLRNRAVGTLADATTTSFFPAKPLGVYGDGGAVFTDDDELAEVVRSIRNHGEGREKYDCVRIGLNGRFDTIQAAVLIEKLKIFRDEIDTRERIARRYNDLLREVAIVPEVAEGSTSVWAQYTIRIPGHDRDAFQAVLKRAGIPTAIYYPRPLHRQTAYKHYPSAGNGLRVAERLAAEVISLPMHPYLTEEVQDRIVDAVKDALRGEERVRLAS